VSERYDPQRFWDETMREEFTTRGIAFPTFPESLNDAMYRTMKDTVGRVLRAEGLGGPLTGKSVLDVGSAIGIWIDYWRRHGAERVVGLDITSAGFDRLRQRFPGVGLIHADIGDEQLDVEEQFDVVSAMNMLLHLTDDARWEQALANLSRLVKPNGVLLIMDPVVFAHERGRPLGETAIERRRHVDRWLEVLERNGLEIVRVEPATVLLATPLDTRTELGYRALWTYWRALMKTASGRERVGAIVGAPLQLADRLLVRIVPRGPTSKCLLVRHRR
jgi:SAM-dependent methyltransferase